MKSSQSPENTQKPVPGSTKRQIVSRLRRAIDHAENLVAILQDRNATGAKSIDILEAKAYSSLIRGSLYFEKGNWERCIHEYALVRVVYATLGASSKTDIYKDLLTSTVDPSIRYAAYQLKMPRTKAVQEIAIEGFPSNESEVRNEIRELDAKAFETTPDTAAVSENGTRDLPATITWRSRNVKIEDASISQALKIAKERENALASAFDSFKEGTTAVKDLAPAYENVITAWQDAVDTTKTAIDELTAEGLDPGDARMQSLQVTRTAVNYAVIEWRVGRNRVLCGPEDGLVFEPEQAKQLSKPRKDGKPRTPKEESSGRQFSRLRERVALYDSILQSLDVVKELPGVVADTAFVKELDAKRNYFRALKCLAIGRSHASNDHITNALALYARAADLSEQALVTNAGQTGVSGASTPRLDVSTAQVSSLTSQLAKLVIRYRALADLKALSTTSQSTSNIYKSPLVERLHLNQYDDDVDLSNLVNYPPTLQPVPVKPLFFDLAWNYIDYPGRKSVPTVAANGTAAAAPPEVEEKNEEQKPAKRGWFGFGRS